jgi:uncharacterized protein YchJ
MENEIYRNVWKRFATDLREVYETLAQDPTTAGQGTLHAQLKQMQGVPYAEIRPALESPRADLVTQDLSGLTDVFFDQAATALIVPALRRSLDKVHIARGCTSTKQVSGIAKAPDLCISLGDQHAVIEFKASPNKRDLEGVLKMRSKFQQKGIHYYLVAGWVSATPQLLKSFTGETPWACFIGGNQKHKPLLAKMPTLDQLVEDMVASLSTS